MKKFFLVVSLWMFITLVGNLSAEDSFHEELDRNQIDSLVINPIKKRLDQFKSLIILAKRRSNLSRNLFDKYRYFGVIGKRDLDDFASYDRLDKEDEKNYNEIVKRYDRLRYFGGIGKRTTGDDDDEISKINPADNYRYFISFGKRADLTENTLPEDLLAITGDDDEESNENDGTFDESVDD